MIHRRFSAIIAVGAAAGALALAGCGSSYDTASHAAPASTAIPCVGAEEACSAKVPIGGGASNRVVEVELTSTDMNEPTIDVGPEYSESYEISDASFTRGGSIYTFTLNAVESIPAGVNLEMTFTQKMSQGRPGPG